MLYNQEYSSRHKSTILLHIYDYNFHFELPCLKAELSLTICILLFALSTAAATSSFVGNEIARFVLALLFDLNAGLYASRLRLIITASVFAFQYARSINGTTKDRRSTVKFLYQIT